MNQAFVFVKPHANTSAVQELVKATLTAKGITITDEGEITGETIDEQKFIDQHYYAIASKATILAAKDLPVPAAKFEETFNESWSDALASGKAFNALDALKHLGCTADELDAAWAKSSKVKFGGGFYCGQVTIEGKEPIYTFNAFFMSMRAKFVTPGTSIHYYVVEFNPEELAWSDFRGKVLGPTDPASAPADSLRGMILAQWESLGLQSSPDVGDNGVHASASPFEGLAERMNWLKVPVEADNFGAALIGAGVSAATIATWSVDPQVKGRSIFDQFEDSNCADCIAKCVELAL
jgi:hypothetical protein